MVITIIFTIAIAAFFIAFFIISNGDEGTGITDKILYAIISIVIAFLVFGISLVINIAVTQNWDSNADFSPAEKVLVDNEMHFCKSDIAVTVLNEDGTHGEEKTLPYRTVEVVNDVDNEGQSYYEVQIATNELIMGVSHKYVLHLANDAIILPRND